MSKRKTKRTTPYASAQSGNRAREEIKQILIRFNCEEVGFLDQFERHELLLYCTHRSREVQLRASAAGWAAMRLREKPWGYRMRCSEAEYRQAVLAQGNLAISSILRDWTKAQVTMIEAGLLTFEGCFLPFMLSHDGRPLVERMNDLLPPATGKIVSLNSSEAAR